ncbi:MAG: hypothetical protein WKF78_14370 [Candidatus Limnocylindrales bacterium]
MNIADARICSSRRSRCFPYVRIASKSTEIRWLVPDHPRIMSWRDFEDIARADLEFRAVRHLGTQATRPRDSQAEAWQVSVPAIGFTSTDQRQPGS